MAGSGDPLPTPGAAEARVEVRGVRRAFQGRPALRGVSFRLPPACIAALVGPDGAGKTTLLRLVAGLIPPDGGEIRLFGEGAPAGRPALRRRLGYVPQRFGLYPDLTVEEHFAFLGGVFGLDPGAAAERRLRLKRFAGLEAFGGRRARDLSGGMRQKLALACALLHDPELLLLDEPTHGLDPLARRDLWGMFDALRRQGCTILLSTSRLVEAESADRLLLLHRGRLLAEGPPREVQAEAPDLEEAVLRRILALEAAPQEAGDG
ncbi:MAG: ABC transporter ATP-binding protein [Desulfobacterales bacterium]